MRKSSKSQTKRKKHKIIQQQSSNSTDKIPKRNEWNERKRKEERTQEMKQKSEA